MSGMVSGDAPALDPARPQRRAAAPGVSAWVAASAGTGKTKVLTDRVLRLLLAGSPPQRLLCLTFTKAAAAEMANRISGVLARWATVSDAELHGLLSDLLGEPPEDLAVVRRARRLFARVLDTPGGLRIQTIHGFCQSLLGRFPIEAGVSPHLEVLDDREAQVVQLEARDALLSAGRSGLVHTAALSRALTLVTGRLHETRFNDVMAALIGERGRLGACLKAYGGAARLGQALRGHLGLGPEDTPESLMTAACADGALDGPGLRRVAAAMMAGGKDEAKRAPAIAAFLAADESLRPKLFEDYCQAFLTAKLGPRSPDRICTKGTESAAPGTRETLLEEQARLLEVVALTRAATIAEATEALMVLAEALLGEYAGRKRSRGRMDYEDLILSARHLLEGSGAAAWVLYKLDGGLDHLLVDEAQDTSPGQWAIVRALADEFFAGLGAHAERPHAADPRTLFVVGDYKQSIYGFQGADPKSFERMYGHFSREITESENTFEAVPLTISFRSTTAVLDAVNAVFANDPARDGVVLAGEEFPPHVAFRDKDGGTVEVWPPLAPLLAEESDPWKPPVERIRLPGARARLADLVAQRIAAMVAGGMMLESRGRAVRPGDVLVLVRRRGGFETDLVAALKARGVAVAGVDRMALTEQIAVMDLMALGKAALLPEDDLTLATVLKGPMIGLDEDTLFSLAYDRRGRRLWDRLRDHAGAETAVGSAHALLEELRGEAARLPPHEFYARLLDGRDGRRRLLARLGPEAEDPIDEFMAQTLAYERLSAPSLQGFLAWLDQGGVEIKRDLDQGNLDAVRVMTVHGSKGLQAPVVILPDTMTKPQQGPLLLWTEDGPEGLPLWVPAAADREVVAETLKAAADRDRDREYRRLLYVAMTRAADHLIVCGWEGKRAAPEDAWYRLIRDALEPLCQQAVDPLLVKAGLEAPVLTLRCPQKRPPKEDGNDRERPAPPPLAEWARRLPPAEPQPPRPLAPSHLGDDPPVRSPLDGGADPLAGARRGQMVHRLLQALPDVPPAEREDAALRWLARRDGETSEEARRDVVDETLAVVGDPRFADLFGPDSRAEVPLVGLMGDLVISGQVDRLVVGDGVVRIVDFKTNRPPPDRPEGVHRTHVRQMAAYRALLSQLFPDHRVECLLLWTDGPRMMELPEALLEEARRGLDRDLFGGATR